MHRPFLIFLLIVATALGIAGCAGSGPAILAKIGDEPLTLQEYEESFAKNNGGWEKAASSNIEDRERFLDLLVRFRLKVKEAKERGLMADSSIQEEMDGYRVSVATSYMLEKEIVEPEIRELYRRRGLEVRASHILFRVDPNAPPADTLAAYEKAMKVIAMIPREPFDSLAARYSEDPGAATNHGDLGFFTSGRMVPAFEDACFSMKPGEYSHVPIRSPFGYHIIKLTAMEPNKGAVRISHILLRFNDVTGDSLAVRDSAWMIYGLLRNGLDFTQAVQRYSQDPGSKDKGGDIGFFERGRVPPHVEAMFYSTPLDSVTKPLAMPYGYHIFKVTAFKPTPPFSEMEKELRQEYQQRRYNDDYSAYVRRLSQRYRVTFDTAAVRNLIHSLDSTITPSNWTWSDTLTSARKKQTLFTCEGRPYSINDFVEHVNASAEFKGMVLNPKNIQYMITRMSEAKIVEEHARHVPDRYTGFSKLLKEYEDGILLYRIEQDEVWKKVVVNDSLLKEYYNANKAKFMWPNRVNFAEIFTTRDSLAQAAYKELQAGKDFGEVAEKYTMRAGYKEKKGLWGLTPDSLNFYSRYAAKLPVDSTTAPFEHPDGYSIIHVIAKDPAHEKSYEEAMPELMSSYQEYAAKQRLERWLSDLRAKYTVVLHKELLPEAFTRKPVAVE